MAEKIEMPQLSDTMESGTIVRWFVEEGDTVERGDVLAEVETDKATMDLEAFDDGVLLEKLIQEGGEAPTQSTIAVIGKEGEDISDLLEDDTSEDAEATEPETTDEETEEPDPDKTERVEKEEPTAGTEMEAEPTESEQPSEPVETEQLEASKSTKTTKSRTEKTETPPESVSRGDGQLRATPVARRMAKKHGIDLHAVDGSGPKGRIIKSDVERAREEGTAFASSVKDANLSSSLQEEERPLSGMRKTIAQRMSEAKREVPHFYLEQEIDVEQVTSLIESLRARDREVNLNDFIMLGAARAFCEVPRMNSSYREDHVKLFGQVDLGLAVAVEDGLFTPVIERAETKSVEKIHEESQELIEKARNGNLQPEEYQGATFTVSNLGMFDIPNFSAVINPPEAGILAVGKAEERPVAEEGELTVGERMSVTLSCDHRAVDGAIGARYLKAFKELMENPARIYMG